MKQKHGARRGDSHRRDPAYLRAVRKLPCRLEGPECSGRIHAHHAGRRPGMGIKPHDHTAIPLCYVHHIDHWHRAAGFFADMDEAQMWAWSDQQITAVQAILFPVNLTNNSPVVI